MLCQHRSNVNPTPLARELGCAESRRSQPAVVFKLGIHSHTNTKYKHTCMWLNSFQDLVYTSHIHVNDHHCVQVQQSPRDGQNHPPRSHKTARSAAQRPTGEASDAAQRNSYTHNFAVQRSECMLHEVGLSTQHEPQ